MSERSPAPPGPGHHESLTPHLRARQVSAGPRNSADFLVFLIPIRWPVFSLKIRTVGPGRRLSRWIPAENGRINVHFSRSQMQLKKLRSHHEKDADVHIRLVSGCCSARRLNWQLPTPTGGNVLRLGVVIVVDRQLHKTPLPVLAPCQPSGRRMASPIGRQDRSRGFGPGMSGYCGGTPVHHTTRSSSNALLQPTRQRFNRSGRLRTTRNPV